MIPLCLVTGFLGTGKTTLLQRLADRYRERRVAWLVNEFSPVDVDGSEIETETDRVVTVAGGSLFCRCLVGDFIRHLTDLPTRFDLPGAALEGVVVEASGIADPRVVRQMLAETKLDRVYQLSAIVTVVDPGSFHRLLATLPNIRAQVEAASLVVLNKTDLFGEDELVATERQLRELNATAPIQRCQFCEAADDVFAFHAGDGLQGEYAKCRDPHYGTFTVLFREPPDSAWLQVWIHERAAAVYRVKGVIQSGLDAQGLRVDYSAAEFRTAPVPAPASSGNLVFIVDGRQVDRIREELCAYGTIIAASG